MYSCKILIFTEHSYREDRQNKSVSNSGKKLEGKENGKI